jgi:hypothetical protein
MCKEFDMTTKKGPDIESMSCSELRDFVADRYNNLCSLTFVNNEIERRHDVMIREQIAVQKELVESGKITTKISKHAALYALRGLLIGLLQLIIAILKN